MLKQVLEIKDILDGMVTGNDVADYLRERGAKSVIITPIDGEHGHTDFLKIQINGTMGKSVGGDEPTLGVIGRLGGVGARPNRIGIVSDADGAIAALAVALKLVEMQERGDKLRGDVIICTHICPNAPILPHKPVPLMNSPVNMEILNKYEVLQEMDAILSIDATKGNIILNKCGIAITQTVLNGYILPVSQELLELESYCTGMLPVVLPICQYDITPYGNGLSHINSIVQPAVAANVPVVGVAITSQSTIPGCATGSCQETDIRDAAVFCVEVAKSFTKETDLFYNKTEYNRCIELYGEFTHFKRSE
ncbi:MAG TPA: DUF1177 domain-containing protein [Clostridiales bacterium]|nr:DUF1177 domain-containing protein [Clostridiales bacterium]